MSNEQRPSAESTHVVMTVSRSWSQFTVYSWLVQNQCGQARINANCTLSHWAQKSAQQLQYFATFQLHLWHSAQSQFILTKKMWISKNYYMWMGWLNYVEWLISETMIVCVPPTCFRGLVWSWLGLHNTSWVVCTFCRLATTGKAGERGLEGPMSRRRWWGGCQCGEIQEGEFPSRSLTRESPFWRMAWPHACIWLSRRVRKKRFLI